MHLWFGLKPHVVSCQNNILTCRIQSSANLWVNYGSKYLESYHNLIFSQRFGPVERDQIYPPLYCNVTEDSFKHVHIFTGSRTRLIVAEPGKFNNFSQRKQRRNAVKVSRKEKRRAERLMSEKHQSKFQNHSKHFHFIHYSAFFGGFEKFIIEK